ncbi:FK506-binding protein 4-like [Nymphaea colorata]|uniref:FK506-binding protein 4-like n=1 Tax=Nymphaea colorata TaxID=210225 RepID=UPI00129E8DBB|nr:FK506-binding protein 4-like [Nymphaea colorata]
MCICNRRFPDRESTLAHAWREHGITESRGFTYVVQSQDGYYKLRSTDQDHQGEMKPEPTEETKEEAKKLKANDQRRRGHSDILPACKRRELSSDNPPVLQIPSTEYVPFFNHFITEFLPNMAIQDDFRKWIKNNKAQVLTDKLRVLCPAKTIRTLQKEKEPKRMEQKGKKEPKRMEQKGKKEPERMEDRGKKEPERMEERGKKEPERMEERGKKEPERMEERGKKEPERMEERGKKEPERMEAQIKMIEKREKEPINMNHQEKVKMEPRKKTVVVEEEPRWDWMNWKKI